MCISAPLLRGDTYRDYGDVTDDQLAAAFDAGHAQACASPNYVKAPYEHPELIDAYDRGYQARRETEHWARYG